MRTVVTLWIFILSFATSLQAHQTTPFTTPIANQWEIYAKENNTTLPGGFYPINSSRLPPGSLRLSLLEDSLKEIGSENIVPTIVGGSGNLNHHASLWTPQDDFFLQKESLSNNKVNLFSLVEAYAGGLKEWTPGSGVHACEGEENDGKNKWRLKKFTFDTLEDYATKEATRKCLLAGGEVQATDVTFKRHTRARKSINFPNFFPVSRKCLSAHVVLKCGFNNKVEKIKALVEKFNREYPNNPSEQILKTFVEDL